MRKYKTGALVTVDFGKIPMIGTVISFDEKEEKYLVRFNPHQQMYYAEAELKAYKSAKKSK